MPDVQPVNRWLTYLRERSPLPLLLVVALPQALSSYYLFIDHDPFTGVVASALGIMGLLVLLRLMDEVKDEEKDKIAHPERPVPRGLLTAAEVRGAISNVSVALLAYAGLLALVVNVTMAVLFVACVGFAWLMYKEFFASEFLNKSPFLYALSHQLIVVLMYEFAVAATYPGVITTPKALWWAFGGLGASFGVEISRKLDPAANPVLKTYLQHYGRNIVSRLLTLSLALTAAASFRLDVQLIVLPFIALAIGTTPVLFLNPTRHKVIAGATGLVALVYMLSPMISYFWGLR